jgi:hypothetical protein
VVGDLGRMVKDLCAWQGLERLAKSEVHRCAVAFGERFIECVPNKDVSELDTRDTRRAHEPGVERGLKMFTEISYSLAQRVCHSAKVEAASCYRCLLKRGDASAGQAAELQRDHGPKPRWEYWVGCCGGAVHESRCASEVNEE